MEDEITPVEEIEDIDPEIKDLEDDVEPEVLKAELERVKKELHKAVQTKKNWRTKYESIAPKNDSLPKTTPEKPVDEVVTRLGKLELEAEKRQFGYAHELSPEETDKAFAYAKGLEIKPEDVLKDTFFQKALESHRSESRQSNATPRSSHRATKVDGKTWNDMTPEEKSKNWNK